MRGAELLLERRDQVLQQLIEVRLPDARVPIRQNGEANNDIGVCELRGLGRLVFSYEGNRQFQPCARHVGVALLGPVDILRIQDAESYAVDLLHHMRQIALQPVTAQADHLDVFLIQVVVQRARKSLAPGDLCLDGLFCLEWRIRGGSPFNRLLSLLSFLQIQLQTGDICAVKEIADDLVARHGRECVVDLKPEQQPLGHNWLDFIMIKGVIQ
mmetsp:Transcript_28857/g.48963  ORF Transcript_28857/g.48963 Transcript_28857/m.48963 type:complete len:213 (+) Transcript_28857:4034-4672(+)